MAGRQREQADHPTPPPPPPPAAAAATAPAAAPAACAPRLRRRVLQRLKSAVSSSRGDLHSVDSALKLPWKFACRAARAICESECCLNKSSLTIWNAACAYPSVSLPRQAAPASARPLGLAALETCLIVRFEYVFSLDRELLGRNTCNFGDPGITLWSPDVYAPGRRAGARALASCRAPGIRR
eukprot:COSAG02_NODE_1324_length_13239_cov_12.346804_8_plen_183_part_00